MIIIIIFIPNFLFSQTYLGVKGGGNFGWYSGEDWRNHINAAEQTVGVEVTDSVVPIENLGIFLDAMIIEHFGFSISININAYGEDCIIGGNPYLRMEYRQNVIEMPLLIKITTSTNIHGGLYLIAGPIMQYLFRDYEMKGTYFGETYSEEFLSSKNTFVFGLLGGIGFEIPSSNGLFKTDVTYGRNITRPSDTIVFPYGIINSIQFNIYYGSEL